MPRSKYTMIRDTPSTCPPVFVPLTQLFPLQLHKAIDYSQLIEVT